MKLAARLLVGLCLLAACGDNKQPAAIDAPAIRDAPADAAPDALQNGCVASDQCTLVASPVCCMLVSPGGASVTFCGAGAGANSCPYVACRGPADPCLAPNGVAGTCTSQLFGPAFIQYFVCQ